MELKFIEFVVSALAKLGFQCQLSSFKVVFFSNYSEYLDQPCAKYGKFPPISLCAAGEVLLKVVGFRA